MKFQTIEQCFMPEKAHNTAIFEVAALQGFEGEWIRLTANDQRKLFGCVVFGKREIKVTAEGTIICARSTCFGTNTEYAEYSASRVWGAAMQGKQLSPGCLGEGFAE